MPNAVQIGAVRLDPDSLLCGFILYIVINSYLYYYRNCSTYCTVVFSVLIVSMMPAPRYRVIKHGSSLPICLLGAMWPLYEPQASPILTAAQLLCTYTVTAALTVRCDSRLRAPTSMRLVWPGLAAAMMLRGAVAVGGTLA